MTRSASRPPCYGGVFDWDTATKRLDELTNLSEKPDFWDDPQAAQAMMRERQKLAEGIETVESLTREADDAGELLELAEGDEGMIADLEASLKRASERAEKAACTSPASGSALPCPNRCSRSGGCRE